MSDLCVSHLLMKDLAIGCKEGTRELYRAKVEFYICHCAG